jgi:hypothetical protein
VPAKKILYFKPAKELKDVLNNADAAPGLLGMGKRRIARGTAGFSTGFFTR